MDLESYGRLPPARTHGNEALGQYTDAEIASELLRRLAADLSAPSRAATEELQVLGERILDRLTDRLDVHTNNWSIAAAARVTYFVRLCVEQHGLPIRDAVHVDLGCGSMNPYGRMFLHMLLGAREGICMDLDPPQDLAKAVRQIARLATAALVRPAQLLPQVQIDRIQVLRNIADFDLERIARGDLGGVPRRLRYEQRSILDTGIPAEAVDVVFTNSVLEHLPDLDRFLAECARITKPGGYGVHGVDFRDHRHYGNSSVHTLQFLCESPGEPMVSGCNRLRRHEVIAAAARHGFEVVVAANWDDFEMDAEFRRRLVSPWREMSDEQLRCRWVSLLVRKRR
jgi:SAM-dependent methyltransferase